MSRFVAAALCAAAVSPAVALAHEGNPSFRSVPTRVPGGLSVEVLNFDDSLALTNRSGRDVVIMGYAEPPEPYARIRADGTVEVNERSPATYENTERFGGVAKPASADARAEPEWRRVDGSGRFVWHDHRSHYMARTTPPQVRDESVRTKVFDWSIPVEVGGRPATIAGTLFWQPRDDGGGVPAGAIVAFVVMVALGSGAVIARRLRSGDDREAW